ncbi:MAG: glycine cleavage system protein GcvH [Chitinophagales bacterium]|nr:glycine cleavage system protein GcvH [Hyphomicrobiales bacterium]
MSIVKYTKDHEYVRVEDGVGIVGVTIHAQAQLGDVVFVELPAVGKSFKKGEQAAVVESVKAASEVYSPISGEVVEANDAITADPALINKDAEGAAWFMKLKIADMSELDALMDEAAYTAFTKG